MSEVDNFLKIKLEIGEVAHCEPEIHRWAYVTPKGDYLVKVKVWVVEIKGKSFDFDEIQDILQVASQFGTINMSNSKIYAEKGYVVLTLHVEYGEEVLRRIGEGDENTEESGE